MWPELRHLAPETVEALAARVRWTVEKNDRYRHLELADDLFAALVATLRSSSFLRRRQQAPVESRPMSDALRAHSASRQCLRGVGVLS